MGRGEGGKIGRERRREGGKEAEEGRREGGREGVRRRKGKRGGEEKRIEKIDIQKEKRKIKDNIKKPHNLENEKKKSFETYKYT